MTKFAYIAAILGAVVSVDALPDLSKREILTALPQNADAIELKFQPYLDFDSDGCYQTAAVDPNGKRNAGKRLGGAVNGQCHDAIQLDHANTYSRRRCNNGICGILYEYYYEKDQTANGVACGGGGCGHKHDFENVVVFVRMSDQKILRVAASQHKGYEARDSGFPLDGSHPLIVYHKDSISTHCNRFANDADIKKPENVKGHFFAAPLVGWLGFPTVGVRDSLNSNSWEGPIPKTSEDHFADYLLKAGSDKVGLNNHGPDDWLL